MIFDRSTFTQEFYGYVPAPGSVSGKFLRDDGTWQNAGGGGGSLIIKEEGVTLTTAATEINFVGSAFTASAIGNAVTLTADPDIVYGDNANNWSQTQTFSNTTAITFDWSTGFNYSVVQTVNGFALRETGSNNFSLEFNETTSVGLLRASDGLQSAEYRFNGDTGAHEFYTNGNLALTFTDAVFTPTAKILFSSIQNIATARVLGRTTGGSGSIEELSAGAGISISAGQIASTITQYNDEQAQDAVGTILVDTATIDLTYNDAAPSITADVKTDSITNTLLANMPASTFKGRGSGSAGDPQDLTAAQAISILNTQEASGAAAYFAFSITDDISEHSVGFKYRRSGSDRHYGLLMTSASGDKFKWVSTPDGVIVNSAYEIDTGGVFSFKKQPNFNGNNLYSAANLFNFTSVAGGLVPASGGGTTNFLRADGAWAAPPGGGGGLSDVDVLARAFMRC